MGRLSRRWNLVGDIARRNAQIGRLLKNKPAKEGAARCPHGQVFGDCEDCLKADLDAMDHWPDQTDCPHGKPIGECGACDVAADLAFDAARERDFFK